MTYVTCPTTRYHPAIIAQKAATMQLLSSGRFTLELGSGENLNEHVVGGGWPTVAVRHDKLEEAVEIIRHLFSGELTDYAGRYFHADSARLWDLPDTPVEIGIAVSGSRSVERFAPLADHLIATDPKAELIQAWRRTRPTSSRCIGQIPIAWDRDKDAATRRARDQFRWFAGGWAVNADIPTPAGFAGATQFVRDEDVAATIACGPDLDAIVETVSAYWDVGFTDIALVQVGDASQQDFLANAAGPLLKKLRQAAPH